VCVCAVRTSENFDEVQFKYFLEEDYSVDYPEYYPFFAMHLHHGDVPAHVGGHILVTIAGQGNLADCISARPVGGGDFEKPAGDNINASLESLFKSKEEIYGAVTGAELEYVVCSPNCLSEADGYATQCVKECPFQFCVTLAEAKSCDGGCDGDERGGDGGSSLVPSRACDLGRVDLPSQPNQYVWIQGKYSDERSGNPSDGDDYSKHSIYKDGNYGKWCGKKIDFLRELFAEGDASYVALHTNPHATGAADYDFGTVLAPINDGSGVTFRDKDGNQVAVPPRECQHA
jgi:hypothetical protein